MQSLLEQARTTALAHVAQGKPASYIPALAQANPNALGLAVTASDGTITEVGESRERFTIQSISKVLALAYVMESLGEEAVFSRVGKEPTGDPFNSIIRLETSARRRPFNPFINAGAIVISSIMPGNGPAERLRGFRSFAGTLAGNTALAIDQDVYVSERESAARNRSIAWFLNELGLLPGNVEACLDTYFMQCALSVNALELSRIGAILALDGKDPISGQTMLKARTAQVIKSLMATCGMYDESGEFAVEVGIPAKSGVGGGILAAVRDRMGIAAYGPSLDDRGNSIGGIEALKFLSNELDLRVL